MKTRTALLFLSLLCRFAHQLIAAEPLDVSLIQLIANPNTYDQKIVRVIGFVRLEFEGNAIYLHQDDYKHGISKNGLWLNATDDMRKKTADFDQKYLLLEGTFNAKKMGHMGLFSGSIQQITRCQVWSEEKGKSDGARLSKAEAIRIAQKEAAKRGYRLSRYEAPHARYEFTRKDKSWTIFYDGKVPKPGNHFLVWVDDRTGEARVMPGE